MTLYNQFGLFFILIGIPSIIVFIYVFRKYPNPPLLFRLPSNFEKQKRYNFIISNIESTQAYDICIEWLHEIGSTITQESRPIHIEGTHYVDIHTSTFFLMNPQTIKDISKRLSVSIQESSGKTKIILDVAIDDSQRDIGRFDFIDFDWYRQEILNQFNSFEIKEKQ